MKQQQYFNLNTNNLYQFDKWQDYGVTTYFSTKLDGTSTDAYASNNLALHVGDDTDNVIANRKLYADKINQPLDNFVFSNQTHSVNVHEVSLADLGKGSLTTDTAIDDCDGLYTFDNNIVINAFVADCTPVYLIDPTVNLICVIHAGWQGTVKSIVFKAINDICQKHNLDPKNFQMLIGPSIAKNSFEVEQDVIDLVNQMTYLDYTSCYTKINDVKYHLDVKMLNYLQGIAAGLNPDNISVTSIDTFTDENLFSYRQNNQTGRMCASIYQTNNN